jgi:hypothetical protein
MDQHQAKLKKLKPGQRPSVKWLEQRKEISETVKGASRSSVFFCNSKGFRRRGWMSAAYPEIGIGAVVPADWCGMGCKLMSKKALSIAQFDGYDGGEPRISTLFGSVGIKTDFESM